MTIENGWMGLYLHTSENYKEEYIQKLAALVRESLDMEAIIRIMNGSG